MPNDDLLNFLRQQSAARMPGYAEANGQPDSKAGWLDKALGIVGAGVGAITGGPSGAMSGYQAGTALGNLGEGAINHTLTPQGVVSGAMGVRGGVGGMAPPQPPQMDQAQVLELMKSLGMLPQGFASGGVVGGLSPSMLEFLSQMASQTSTNALGSSPTPSPEEILAGDTAALGTAPTPTPLRQASHPGWEAVASIAGDVLKNLPRPKPERNGSDVVGNWSPAAAALVGGIPDVLQNRRAGQNQQIVAQNNADKERYKTAASDLAKRRWELAIKKMDKAPVAPGPLEGDIPDALRKQLGVPMGVKTYRDLNEWQQSEARRMAGQPGRDAKAQQQTDENALADQMADDIAHFRSEPVVSMSGRSAQFGARVKNRVNEILKAEGSPHNFNELTRLSGQQKVFQQNTANSPRFAQLRQSAQTVRQHLDQFDEFFKKYQKRVNPSDVRLMNKGVYALARGGYLGPDAAADATALETTGEALGKEIAVVLRGGFAPFKKDIDDADTMVATYLGPKSNAARIKTLRRLLKARIVNAVEATPFAGGKDNPYLLEASPLEGWDASAEQAKAATGWKPPGAKEVVK